MSVVSLQFAGFVTVALVIYYLIPARVQTLFLLVASLVFCASWSWQFVVVLLMLAIFNFVVGQYLQPDRHPSPALLGFCIGVNVVALFAFKYGGIFGVSGTGEPLAPLGISFYTLTGVSYLVDVYRGQVPASSSVVEFAVLIAYFPKLLSGPIERARTFLPQLTRSRVIDNDALARSLALIVLGCVRKLVIADTITRTLPRGIFERPDQFTAPDLGFSMLVYLFVLYNDFAGYTDIARGVSGLFGIELSPNFRTPAFSRSFTEFWTRWHITLSNWLRDYIYFPLSRALLRRQPDPRQAVNLVVPLMATLLLSGLWHSAHPGVLLWGALMGVLLVAERLTSSGRGLGSPDQWPRWRQRLGILVVFVVVAVCAVPFHMELPIAMVFWKGLFQLTTTHVIDRFAVLVVAVLCGLSLLIDWVQYRSNEELVFLRWPLLVRCGLLVVAILAVFLATRGELPRDFVYQGF